MKHILWLLLFVSLNVCAQSPKSWIIGGSQNMLFDFSSSLNITNLPLANIPLFCTSAQISDKNGNLLYISNGFSIWNSNYQKVQNADTLAPCNFTTTYYNTGNIIWQNAVFVPDPGDTNEFYLFYSSGDIDYWYPNGPYPCSTNFYYAKINKTINGNAGLVTSKNVVIGTDTIGYSVCAIKHGNGRDWWIIKRHNHYNKFIRYLVSPSGVAGPFYQTIGTLNYAGFTNFKFAPLTNKVACYNAWHLYNLHHCEIYDFDRCSGLFSNPVTLTFTDTNFWPNPGGCEFSPNGTYLYVSTMMKLRQFDVTANNIAISEVLIDSIIPGDTTKSPTGLMQLGPDGKIYMSINSSAPPWMHVINYPDSAGLLCNFVNRGIQFTGFHALDLPNIPAYELGPAWGSGCDTITGSLPTLEGGAIPILQSTYVAAWQKLFVNAQNIKGKNCVLRIFDVNGREVYSSTKKIQPPYFTMDVDVSSLAAGFYLINLSTEKEMLNGRFIKE